MKTMIRNIAVENIIIFFSLIILSAVIWFAGPHFIIANHFSLVEPEKRFGIIMVLFLGWALLKLVFMPTVTAKAPEPAPTPTPETMKKLEALQNRFEGAMEFLKKTVISKHGENINLSHLPWYIFIGPNNSGKTSLLANSNINFILAKQFKPETLKSIQASEGCDWWVTRDLVLVDIPSNYIHAKEKTSKNSPRASMPNVLWYNLLNLIHTHREQNSLSGIVVALNLPELMKQSNNQQQKAIVADIRYRILELREKFGKHLPCHFTITKCDLLPGFLEFFSESSSEELAQAWGVTLPALNTNDKLVDVLSHRFNALIKRLNKQLIWRMHQERNATARTLIKDFPLQMERVKVATIQFMKALSIPDLHLNGIFFTSSIQHSHEEIAAQSPLTINQTSHQALQILQEPVQPTKAFFVRQFILQGLLHTQEHAAQIVTSSSHWERRAAYAAATVAIVLAAIFLGKDFRHGIQQTYSIQNDLSQYQLYIQQANQQSDHLVKALPLLNALQQAAENSTHNLSRIANFLSFYSHKSQKTATEVYAQALQTIVLPQIKNDLEGYLRAGKEKNPTQLYSVLEAYLMLGDATHLQNNYVASMVTQLLSSSLDKKDMEKLREHVNAALAENHQALKLNTSLIEQSQKLLTSLPATDLAYVILKNMGNNNQDSILKLGTDSNNGQVFESKTLANQIPNMFTADSFQAVISNEINQAATEATQGNWIIGNQVQPNQNTAALADQLRSQYVANYIDIWESQLANIKLYAPKNLNELNTALTILTSNNSPLLQMLQTIQNNTAFDIVMNASPKLQALNNLLANANNNQDNTLYQMFVGLQELRVYVQNIATAGNSGNSAFIAAKQHLQGAEDALVHMNTLVQHLPDPMKSWLTNMSNQSWNLISETAAQYIDNIWQKNVFSTYQTQIANRFPFSRTATNEVSLTSFIGFLGQQGMFNNFYLTYLKPFIDDSQSEWQWRSVGNQQLPFKDELLQQLQTALKIQRAFFPNGDNQLYVQFSLQPISLEEDMKSFNLTINGQQINYQKTGANETRVVSWPGNNNGVHATKVNFVTQDNQLISDALQGDWGWFRLVDKATKTVNTRKEIELSFDVNGHKAKYLLFTQGHLNPFLPLNLERLQLPESLV